MRWRCVNPVTLSSSSLESETCAQPYSEVRLELNNSSSDSCLLESPHLLTARNNCIDLGCDRIEEKHSTLKHQSHKKKHCVKLVLNIHSRHKKETQDVDCTLGLDVKGKIKFHLNNPKISNVPWCSLGSLSVLRGGDGWPTSHQLRAEGSLLGLHFVWQWGTF